MAAHLAINGLSLQVEELAAYSFVMDLYTSGRFRMSDLEAWLRSGVVTESLGR